MADWLSGSRGLLVRAPRFPLQMRVRYRGVEEKPWREAQTENISRSGVLFHVEELMALDTPVEMLLFLPAELSGQPAAAIHCRGEIVRQVAPEVPEVAPALAARIRDYRLLPRRAENSLLSGSARKETQA
jgi:hypothetical protein